MVSKRLLHSWLDFGYCYHWSGFIFLFFDRSFLFETMKLCTVSDSLAPFDICSFIFTISNCSSLFSLLGSYEPRTSRYLPLFGPFFESVRTRRKTGSFFLPTRCRRIINILLSHTLSDLLKKGNMRYSKCHAKN